MANKTIHELTQISTLTKFAELPMWDPSNSETKKTTVEELKNLIAEGIVAGVSFIGTRAQYNTAKMIPAGQEGHIPSGSLVIITDENRTYVTNGILAEQTLQLVARVMSAGDGITITNDDKIKADTVTFTGTRAEWELLSSSAKAKYNIVNFTDEELTEDVITDTVEDGNMLAVTSNAVANIFSSQIDNTKFSITSAGTYVTAQYTGLCYLAVYANDTNTTNVYEDDVAIMANDIASVKTFTFLVRKGHRYKYERAINFISCNFIPFNI